MSLRRKLEDQVDIVHGAELESHFRREALLILAAHMNLVEVGVAFAEDDKDQVKAWIDSKELVRADVKSNSPEVFDPMAHYEFLILQPFVIAKRIQTQ